MRYIYIALFGFCGAVVRFLLESALPATVWTAAILGGAPFPLTTLLVNAVGCFVLPLIFVYAARASSLPVDVASGMGVGLVGAFTTLSTFCSETIELLQAGFIVAAVVYVVLTMVTSLGASWLGYALGTRMLKRHRARNLAELRGLSASGGDDHAA